jgi:hypothetical protein
LEGYPLNTFHLRRVNPQHHPCQDSFFHLAVGFTLSYGASSGSFLLRVNLWEPPRLCERLRVSDSNSEWNRRIIRYSEKGIFPAIPLWEARDWHHYLRCVISLRIRILSLE